MRTILFFVAVMATTMLMSSTSSNSTHYGSVKTGNITAAEFKAQLGLIAWLDDFDFDAKCTVQSYTLYYTPKREDPVALEGKGGTFNGKVNQIVKQAKSGDQYAFMNVKVKCPGDKVGRSANSLYFKIR